MIVSGVDGCSAGWICIARDQETGSVGGTCYPSAEALFRQEPRPALIAIDVPIGLPDKGARACDLEARKRLGPRGSSVFPAPLRPMLPARSWEEACEIRESIEGKRVSKQLWGILPKIREVDELMSRDTAGVRSFVREVHPEVSFLAWSGRPLEHSKRKRPGRLERRRLVEEHFGAHVLALVRRHKGVSDDDILDAFAALWTAERIFRAEAVTLPASPPRDSLGLPMEIVY